MPTRDAALNTTRLVRLPSLFDSRGGRFVDGQWRPIAGYQWGGTAGADRQGEFPRQPNIPAPPEPQAAGLPVARALPVAGQGPRSVAGQRPPARVSGAAPASTPGTGLAAHPAAPPARTPQAEPPPLTQRPPAALPTRTEPDYAAIPLEDEKVYNYLRDNGREDLAADVGTLLERVRANGGDFVDLMVAYDSAASDANIPIIEFLAGLGRGITEGAIDIGEYGFGQAEDATSAAVNLGRAGAALFTPGGRPGPYLSAAAEDSANLTRRTVDAALGVGNAVMDAADPRSGGTAGMAVRALNDAGGFAPVSATGEAPRPTPASRDGLSFGGRRGGGEETPRPTPALDLTGARRATGGGRAPTSGSGGIPMPDSTRTSGQTSAGGLIPASARSSSGGSGGRGAPSGGTGTASGRGSRTGQPRDLLPEGRRTSAEDLNRAVHNVQAAPETALRQLARGSGPQAAAARRELYQRRQGQQAARDPIGGGEPTRGQRGLY